MTQPNLVPLTEQDFADAAKEVGCSVAAIKAVAKVESLASGMCPDGFPVTLFEGHHFSRYTKGAFDKSHPTISYPKWTTQFYGKGWRAERARLDQAIKLSRNAALLSASWGKFQIMGFNFARCGFDDVQTFVNAMCKSERAQLDIFVDFVKASGLSDELRDLRWVDFARHYNGPGQVTKYADLMAKAYNQFR